MVQLQEVFGARIPGENVCQMLGKVFFVLGTLMKLIGGKIMQRRTSKKNYDRKRNLKINEIEMKNDLRKKRF